MFGLMIFVYIVITTDYTSITVDNPAVEIAVGEETNIKCDTVPSSIVDFNYTYESLDASIAEVDKLGKITAKNQVLQLLLSRMFFMDLKKGDSYSGAEGWNFCFCR